MPVDRDGDGPPLRRSDNSKAAPEKGGGNLRATPFTDDVFNDDYYGRRGSSSGAGSKSISVIIGITLGVVIAGGAGWYFLGDRGLVLGPSEGSLIKADPIPYKVPPKEPGGMEVANQDKLVYDRLAKGETPARVENLLPPAEEPKAPPVKPKAEEPKTDAIAAEIAKTEAAPPPPAKDMAKAEERPAETKPAAPAKPEPDPLAAAVAAATEGRTSATGPINTAAPAADAPKSAEPAPKPGEEKPAEAQTAAATPAPAPAEGVKPIPAGAFQVQLVSVLSEEAANAEWKRISGKHKELLDGLSPAISRAEIADKGTYYRLRAGPLADKAAADTLCSALAAQNVGCIVVKP